MDHPFSDGSNPQMQSGEKMKAITQDPKTERSGRWFWSSLVLCLLVGLTLRVTYLNQHYFNPDEEVARAVVKGLNFPRQWDTNWGKSDVAAIWHYNQYNFSSYHYTLYFWKGLLSLLGIDWDNNPGALRACNGVFGLVFIGMIALATRHWAGDFGGIAAAFAAAIAPLLVQDAHYLRCESMLTAGVAVLLWLPPLREPTRRWILISGGLITGWMIAGKASMGLAAPLLLLLLFKPADSPALLPWRTLGLLSGLIGFGVMLGFVLGVPLGAAQPRIYLSGLAKLAQEYNNPMPPYTSPDMAPSIQAALAYLRGTLGWGFWTVTALGLMAMTGKWGWRRTTVLLLPLLAALSVFGQHPLFAERSYSPFLPIVLIFFGAGIHLLVEKIARHSAFLRKRRSLLLPAVLLPTLALPLITSWQIVFRCFSGREQMARDATIYDMRGDYRGKKVAMNGSAFGPKEEQVIAAAIEHQEPLFIILIDFYDPVTPRTLAMLQNKYAGQIRGVREGLFPELPTCTLHTFSSPRIWALYIPAKPVS